MIAFGYAAKGVCTDDMTYYEVGPDGRADARDLVRAPYYCMMHDFGDHPRLRAVPRRADHLAAGSGWSRGCRISASTRRCRSISACCRAATRATAEDIRWFKRANCFASHVMNAFQDGTKIHFDTPEAKNNMFPFFPDVHGAPFNPMEAASFLTRWTVDMASNCDEFESRQRLTDMVGEFPRIDDRYAGEKYRYGWMLVIDMAQPVELKGGSAGGMLMNTLGLVDHRDRRRSRTGGAARSPPCRSPASSRASKDAPEGDGWIVHGLQPARRAPHATCCCSTRSTSTRARSRRSISRSACASACTAIGRTRRISAWRHDRAGADVRNVRDEYRAVGESHQCDSPSKPAPPRPAPARPPSPRRAAAGGSDQTISTISGRQPIDRQDRLAQIAAIDVADQPDRIGAECRARRSSSSGCRSSSPSPHPRQDQIDEARIDRRQPHRQRQAVER